jgi:hypothetical protein
VRGVRESGATLLTFGAISDGQYFRRSGTTVVGGNPAAGSFAATQVEVDLGWPAVRAKEFTITDANAIVGSKIVATIAYEDTVDHTADEVTVSEVFCSAGKSVAGSFTLALYAAAGPIGGKFKINYAIG